MSESTPMPSDQLVPIDPEELWQARMEARCFRSCHAPTYPGMLHVLQDGSFCLVPVADEAYDPPRQRPMGIALWGPMPYFPGCTRFSDQEDGPSYVPTVCMEDRRPLSGVPRIDAWIARADALQWLLRGQPLTFGPLPLTPAQMIAGTEEVAALTREMTIALLRIAPATQRHALLALATLADSPGMTVQLLAQARIELLASAAAWKYPDKPIGSVTICAPDLENPTEKEIVEALRKVGHRMTTDVLLTKAIGGTTSYAKGVLANLVRRGVLNNRSDVRPRGYGFPDWT